MLNNFLFLSITAVTFAGTYFPVPTELFTGQKVTVGAPFYESVNGILFACVLVLMGIAPLAMWYRTSIRKLLWSTLIPVITASITVVILLIFGVSNWIALLGLWIVAFSLMLTLLEFYRGVSARMRSKGENPFTALATLVSRKRRRYGGYIIHIGILVMAVGIISNELYQQETQIFLERGDSVSLGDFTMTFNGIDRYPGPDDLLITEANVDVYKNGEFIRTLGPRTELYTRTQQPMTIPAVRSTFTEDFYVILVNWEGTTIDGATFRVFLNPLINWIWAGGIIFIIGTLVAAWRDPADEKIKAAAGTRGRIAVRSAVGD
jgi:cytochrome c-type biogenesis protein CcmF